MFRVSYSFFWILIAIRFYVAAKGVSGNMLKDSSKRRRTQAQIKAEKEAALQKQADEAAKDAEIHSLQQQVMQLSEDVKTGQLATVMMQQFVESGVVEHDGGDDFIVHSSQGEKSFSSKKK